MKTISMEFSEYKEELSNEFQKGFEVGKFEVFRILKDKGLGHVIKEIKEQLELED